MDDKTRRLLKVLREQIGDHPASLAVDTKAAADRLGVERDTLDFHRSLHDLVRAGYLEPDPHSTAPSAQRMYRITFSGIYATDNH